MKDLDILTPTNTRTWNDCKFDYYLRNVEEIVPLEVPQPLRFGSLIHTGLEALRRTGDIDAAIVAMDLSTMRTGCEDEDYYKAKAMLIAYSLHYGDESKKIFVNEGIFEMPVWNLETGAESRTFKRMGKIDCIMKEDDGYWLYETKTAASIDEGYLSRLWMDQQITFYALGAQVQWGIELKGVVYDVIVKSRLKKKEEETPQAFEQRKAGLLAKSKTGKTTAKRQMGETEDEYTRRLAVQYLDVERMFHRERIYITQDKLQLVEREMWALCEEIRLARKQGLFRRNTSNCWKYNRPCRYFRICSATSDESREMIKANYYQHKPANHELLNEEETQEVS